jgi:hypothetical protein
VAVAAVLIPLKLLIFATGLGVLQVRLQLATQLLQSLEVGAAAVLQRPTLLNVQAA